MLCLCVANESQSHIVCRYEFNSQDCEPYGVDSFILFVENVCVCVRAGERPHVLMSRALC